MPTFVSARANRDLEFLWSNSYRVRFNRALDSLYSGSPQTDLDRYGRTICDDPGANPFGFPFTDIRMVYDYLNRPNALRGTRFAFYISSQDSSIGYIVNQPTYPDDDRKHVDTYLYAPRFAGDPGFGSFEGDTSTNYGYTPSAFTDTLTEDLSTGHIGAGTLVGNAIALPGPRPSQVGDLNDATRWTGADQSQSWVFNHEFQHVINNFELGTPNDEFASSAAEALAGERPDAPMFDVSYLQNIIEVGGNYEAWRSLSAYLAYQFRGVDVTSAGLSDDLIWRWAKGSGRRLPDLAARLASPECGECDLASKSYLNGLSGADRVHRVLHNWRVAQYVNRSDLAQGQFGFPPQFGFDPIRDVGNWKNLDLTNPDTMNVPNETTVSLAQVGRDWSFAGPGGGAKAHALSLEPFGSDYWVIRSDPALSNANHDLIIRMAPEGTCPGVRFMVSIVTYSNQPSAGDSLWKHPEWVTGVTTPVMVDLDNASTRPFEVLVPTFGLTHKALLIVITTSELDNNNNAMRIVPYRLNLALRSGTYLSPNPTVVFRDAAYFDLPAWNPKGDSLAFNMNVQPGSAFGVIHVKGLAQAGSRPLIPEAEPHSQAYPDWSPRGDWVAFTQESTATDCDIHVYNTVTGERRRLATSPDDDVYPAFSPNGQMVAYSRSLSGGTWELHRVNLDGSGDVVLLNRGADITSPRWSPDGKFIYFASGHVLYAVSSDGSAEINKSNLIPYVDNFDLALTSAGRILAQDLGGFMSCGAPGTQRERLVARDSTAGESEELFMIPGQRTFHPRWSFDNTRVAFVVDSVGQRDIRVGQVGYNHAPHFTALNDSGFLAMYPVSFPIHASDPNGEALTYQAAYLPPGATYSSDGQFTWPSPQAVGADAYYVVFRAIDPSGGVDNRVVKFEIIPAPGGCPMVDARAAAGWQLENSILGRSLTGDLATDYYQVRGGLAPVQGRYQLRIRENEQEHTTLDQVRLWAVDHAASERAFATATGVVLGERRPAYRVTTQDGRDVTGLMAGTGTMFQGQPGDTLLVEMSDPAAAPDSAQGLLEEPCCEKEGPQLARATRDPGVDTGTDAQWLTRTGVVVQVPDDAGGWRTVQHRYPREREDQVAIELEGADQMRLIFMGRQRLEFVGGLVKSGKASPLELPLLAARHSKAGDALGALLDSGGGTAGLDPGDTLNVEFAAPPVAEGKVRDWFLVSTGVYTSDTTKLLGSPGSQPLPVRFALAQNRPNPFGRSTSIRFELPAASQVRLEVFDLLGRRVAKLADREYPAGYHSVDWSRSTASGIDAPPGVYLYRLTAGSFRDQKKMILLP